jgi:DNA-directed RNA polymerase specialized sigma24 family protein
MTMRRQSCNRGTTLSSDLSGHDARHTLWAADPDGWRALARDRALRDAIASSLTEKQREVVVAYFFEGESQGQIARRLGITQQVVQKRIFGVARGDKWIGGALACLRRTILGEARYSAARPLRP